MGARCTGHRNTPASAGRTRGTRCSRPNRPEHPRVGGEDTSPRTLVAALRGTPPRRRGGPAPADHVDRAVRNTPASAGRTSRRPPGPGCGPEHPRVGGEDPGRYGVPGCQRGTPPRRRGGHRPCVSAHREDRNTPASAGRTGRLITRNSCPAEHPRVGGEDCALTALYARRYGTPPRRRGGRERGEHRREHPRNTPASAGRTSGEAGPGGTRPEHPRVGGEDVKSTARTLVNVGTPPRRRGGPSG